MTELGAIHVGHKGVKLDQILSKHPSGDAFIFYFSSAAMEGSLEWQPNLDLLVDLLQHRSSEVPVVIFDTDAQRNTPRTVRLAEHQDQKQAISDLLQHRAFMSDKCFADCHIETIEQDDIKSPIQRWQVTIPYPVTHCSVAKVHEWLCPRCMLPIEYGHSDRYIYCACGRSLFSNYTFK